jgi:hypothetical protein
MADLLHHCQRDEAISQQTQTPVVAPIRRRGTGQRNQVGFLFAIQASGARPTERTAIERSVQPLLCKHSPHPHER